MLSYILLALSVTMVISTTLPPFPTTIPPPGCERDGKFYGPGEDIPTSDPCESCRCEVTGYSVEVRCRYADFLTPMCFDPEYHGGSACQPYSCRVRNCKTPSGHVLIDSETRYFDDDGYCACPPQSFNLPGAPWVPANGMADCTPATTTPPPTTTTTTTEHLVG